MLSIILPAKDEAESLCAILPRLASLHPEAEIIVVDDGSSDGTREICRQNNVNCIVHPYSKGNGAAIKTGARAASGDVLVTMDADGQHRPEDVQPLLDHLAQGYDMVVGQRHHVAQATWGRRLANGLYNRLASMVTGQVVKDLTSGFRAVAGGRFRRFLYLLPNGFSYPTSITMAFFRAGYSVDYLPVQVEQRTGNSHIRPLRDGVRFLLIIFRIATLYSPLKIFFPVSFCFFALGISHYAYVYLSQGRFTNMSAMLFITALLVFLIGLVSEQVTTLLYSRESGQEN